MSNKKRFSTTPMYEDKKMDELAKIAILSIVKTDSLADKYGTNEYEKAEKEEEIATENFYQYCLTLLPEKVYNQVKNSKSYRARVLDKFIFAQ